MSRKGGHVWEELAGTLRAHAGDNQLAVLLQHNPTDSRIKIDKAGLSQTLTARMGTGGNNVPLLLTAYGIGSHASKGMLSDNPHSGIYEANTSRTLDSGGGNPGCHQGGMAVVEETYSMAVAGFSNVSKDIAGTLTARDYKDAPLVASQGYRARRLLPCECAMLQGFPSDWCSGLETPNPSEKDIAFWSEVFETHRKALGKSSRPRSRNQVVKWLKNPHSDRAEYALWGNAVPLPCVIYVLRGIVSKMAADNL